jgi:hypothetical protein
MESYPRWDSRWTIRLKCLISHTGQPQKDNEALFDYGKVDEYSFIELMIIKAKEKTSSIIGGLFIRVLDIINYTQRKDSTDVIDAWFEIAPAGKCI